MEAQEVEKILMSADDAGTRIGRCGEVVREAARRGEIPCIKLGRNARFFLVSDIDRWWRERIARENSRQKEVRG